MCHYIFPISSPRFQLRIAHLHHVFFISLAPIVCYCKASNLVLLLDTALALIVDEGATGGAFAALTPEEHEVAQTSTGGLGGADVVVLAMAASTASQEEEDGSKEHGSPCAPGEAESIFADVGADTCVTELIAGFDEDGTGKG